jgi:transcriptional regulator with XRE-family HTH domain
MNPTIQVRRAAGLTQLQFARRLGLSLQTIKNTERGKPPITRDTATKIHFGFGATMKSLTMGRQALYQLSGKPYTEADAREWKSIMKLSDAYLTPVIQSSAARIRDLLIVGNSKDSLPAILRLIEEMIEEAVHHCDLLLPLRRMRKQRLEEIRINPLTAFCNDPEESNLPFIVPMLNSTVFEMGPILDGYKKRKAGKRRKGDDGPSGVPQILEARRVVAQKKADEEKKRLAEAVRKFRTTGPARKDR